LTWVVIFPIPYRYVCIGSPILSVSGYHNYCTYTLTYNYSFMDWKNAVNDGLPINDQEVLISVQGVNYLAVYLEKEKGFRIKDDGKFLPLHSETIYWYPITQPYS
jgi:hypothetical protein